MLKLTDNITRLNREISSSNAAIVIDGGGNNTIVGNTFRGHCNLIEMNNSSGNTFEDNYSEGCELIHFTEILKQIQIQLEKYPESRTDLIDVVIKLEKNYGDKSRVEELITEIKINFP